MRVDAAPEQLHEDRQISQGAQLLCAFLPAKLSKPPALHDRSISQPGAVLARCKHSAARLGLCAPQTQQRWALPASARAPSSAAKVQLGTSALRFCACPPVTRIECVASVRRGQVSAQCKRQAIWQGRRLWQWGRPRATALRLRDIVQIVVKASASWHSWRESRRVTCTHDSIKVWCWSDKHRLRNEMHFIS